MTKRKVMKSRNKVTLSVGSPHVRESGNFLLVESNNKCFTSVIFFVWVKIFFNLACTSWKKLSSCVFKVTIDHLCDNPEPGRRNYCFGKSLEKVWNFGSKICTNPTLTSKIRNTGIQYLESGIHGMESRIG